ncbi:hypothetical protein BAMY_18545 [Bacillus amyloliquefaciens]|nr:hypothetical protein AAV29_19400 [Bacillus velezensis]AMP33830.1 hypothetical protein AS588_18210 [Bacillus amyloliquefaciens]KMN55562.1 hypothetical protein VK94_11640 [Bacillus sp. LK7]APB84127.1 hypothetical protein BAMY_18545 [Bacillus amyloliquefaciens]ASF57003.1 hypothetical protein CEG11_18655 [Bacillus velezensis]
MISHHNLLFYINNSILSLLLPIGNTEKEENKVLFIKRLKNNAEVVWFGIKTSSPQTEKVCKRNVPEKAGKIDIQQREEDNKSRKAGFICLKKFLQQ